MGGGEGIEAINEQSGFQVWVGGVFGWWWWGGGIEAINKQAGFQVCEGGGGGRSWQRQGGAYISKILAKIVIN